MFLPTQRGVVRCFDFEFYVVFKVKTLYVALQLFILTHFNVFFFVIYSLYEQIDLRKESTIQFVAPSSYPVITFGPFASPNAVLMSLSHAIGNYLKLFSFCHFIF